MDELRLGPVTSITMTDQVEMKLRDYIKRNNFQAGDALPKELELVEILGVSRSVVREALSRLRMLGMVDTRKGRGMVLTEPDVLSGFERLLEPHFLAQNTMKQLFEIRLMLEVGLSDFLFKRVAKKDFQKLEDILAREAAATTREELVQTDVLFHATLYKITGNQTLIRFQKMLLPLFQYITDYKAHLATPHVAPPVTHRDLVELLRHGNAEQFRVAMKEHFSPHFDVIP